MAFGDYTSGALNTGGGAAPSTGVHGVTINDGDLVAIYVNSNSTTEVTHAGSEGTAFTREVSETPSPETAQQAFFWKEAGPSEPTSYTFAAGDAQWQIHIRVFDGGSGVEVDSPINTVRTGVNANDIVCEAIDGAVISDNALSMVFGGKDNRGSSELYTTSDNSFVQAIGDRFSQAAASAHRFFTTGETFSGSVIIETDDAVDGINDRTYSVHISFIEADGGVTLVIDDSAHGHSADNIALIQANLLAIQDALHSHSSDNIDLVQATILAIAETLHAHNADNVALIQANALSIAEALHGHLADNIALTQANVLAIADALHAHTADNTSLSVGVALAIAETLHAVLSDNVDLVQANVLAIQETLHGLSSDELSLTQANTLQIQETLHGLGSDNLTLLSGTVLAIAETLHAHLGDNIELTQANVLSISDTLHAVQSDNVILTESLLLAIDETLHSHLAENVELQVGSTLAIASAVHALMSANVDLTQASTLVIDDTLHALLSDVITFGEVPVSKESVLVVESRDRILIVAPRRRRLT